MTYDLEAINPANSDKYSPNLYKWMRKKRRWPIPIRVFESDGHLYIGYIHDREFTGAKLNAVLCDSRTQEYCYVGGQKFVEVSDFWERYTAIGRCAIDQAHSMRFIGDEDRYVEDGDTRTCQWCGAVQHRRRWTETVECEEWEMESEAVSA